MSRFRKRLSPRMKAKKGRFGSPVPPRFGGPPVGGGGGSTGQTLSLNMFTFLGEEQAIANYYADARGNPVPGTGSPFAGAGSPWGPGPGSPNTYTNTSLSTAGTISFITTDDKLVSFHQFSLFGGGSTALLQRGLVAVHDVSGAEPTLTGWSIMDQPGKYFLEWRGTAADFSSMAVQLSNTRYVLWFDAYANVFPKDDPWPTRKSIAGVVDVNLTSGSGSLTAIYDMGPTIRAQTRLSSLNDDTIAFAPINSTDFIAFAGDRNLGSPLNVESDFSSNNTAIRAATIRYNGPGSPSFAHLMPPTLVALPFGSPNLETAFSDLQTVLLDATNRIVAVEYETNQTSYVAAVQFDAGYTGITTVGPRTEMFNKATYRGVSRPKLIRIDDTHGFVGTQHNNTTERPEIVRMFEVNPANLAVTVGPVSYISTSAGGDPNDEEIDYDRGYTIYGGNNLILAGPFRDYNDPAAISSGAALGTLDPYEGTIFSGDNMVDTAANMGTTWGSPGAYTTAEFTTVDTGDLLTWNGSSWSTPTNAPATVSSRGTEFYHYTFDTSTLTFSFVAKERTFSTLNPRYESDGAGGVRQTFKNVSFDGNDVDIHTTSTGKLVCMSGELDTTQRTIHAPVLNPAQSAANAAPIWASGGFDIATFFFDPTKMP